MFHWQFASRNERPASWYIIALVVVLFLVIYGILEKLYLMSVASFLFAGVYIMIENNSTPMINVEITENGIQVQNTYYEYSQIASFAILSDEHIARTLRFFMKKGISSFVDIPLTSDVNPSMIKSYLAGYLPENSDAEFSKSDRMIQAMRL